MQKISYVEELLPNFEQFLEDLSNVKLTSDLERRVKTYKQRIKTHIQNNSKQPGTFPPKLPGSNPPFLYGRKQNDSDVSFLARQRIIARENQSSSGGSITPEDDSKYEAGDSYYLEPTKPPPVPSTLRPDMKLDLLPGQRLNIPEYEEDNGQDYYEFNEDKNNNPGRIIDDDEDQLLYQDVDSENNYNDDFSDSTDFEDVGEGDQVTTPVIQTQSKQKKTKLEMFTERFTDDPQVDMIGELVYCTGSRFSKWVKKYCVARDMHLLCYNGLNKKVSLDVVLPGHKVTLMARCNNKKNVLVINHPSKGDMMFSSRTREEAERWLGHLEEYATLGHEIDPSSGYVDTIEEPKPAKTKDKKKQKKKDKKKDKTLRTPELSVDDKGILSGNVNLYGIHFGEPKWKKYWISIKEHTFNCHMVPNGTVLFNFDLRKTTIDLSEEKSSRESTTLQIISGDDVYVRIEPLNMIDSGRLLKGLVAGVTSGAKAEQKQSGLVSRLMEAFEQSQKETPTYEAFPGSPCPGADIASPTSDSSLDHNTGLNVNSSKGLTRDPSLVYFIARGTSLDEEIEKEDAQYCNREAIRNMRQANKMERPLSADFKIPEEEPSPKSDNRKSSTLGRFFSKNTSSTLAPKEENKEKLSPKASPKMSSKAAQKTEVAEKKPLRVAELGKPDLVLASKLSEERTEKEAKRKELNQKKKELRMKKFTLKTDEDRDECDKELRGVQKEWNEVNSCLVDLEKKIYLAKAGILDETDGTANNSNSTGANDAISTFLLFQ